MWLFIYNWFAYVKKKGKNMKKTNCLRLGVLLFSSIALLASCGAKDNSKKYTVTFYDGETVLKEEKVKENLKK